MLTRRTTLAAFVALASASRARASASVLAMASLALGVSLWPRFMFCMRVLAFLAKWLGIAHTPRPVGWAERRVFDPLPGPVLGPEQLGLCCPHRDQANGKCCQEGRADEYRIEAI